MVILLHEIYLVPWFVSSYPHKRKMHLFQIQCQLVSIPGYSIRVSSISIIGISYHNMNKSKTILRDKIWNNEKRGGEGGEENKRFLFKSLIFLVLAFCLMFCLEEKNSDLIDDEITKIRKNLLRTCTEREKISYLFVKNDNHQHS